MTDRIKQCDVVDSCEDCRHCIDGICTNAFGMLGHGVDKDDFCNRGERL